MTISLISKGHDYNTGIGLRLGLYNGLTIKHFITENKALEGLIVTRWNGFNITGLYEIHDQAFNVERLHWYYGFGGHIGSWRGEKSDNNIENYTFLGVDGIIGMEYNFKPVPFNISLDWKPTFSIIGHTEFLPDQVALSIRYIF